MPKGLCKKIEKVPPVAKQRDGRMLQRTLEIDNLFLKLDPGELIPHKGSTYSLTQLHWEKIAATSSKY